MDAVTRASKMADSLEVGGIRLTHPDRVLYPEQGLTKADIAKYILAVSRWMLPHLARRPLNLVRCPQGEDGVCFYQKHFDAGLPDGVHGVSIEEKEARQTYATVDDLRGLIALVQIGVLEFHPWGSTIDRLEQPDRLIFDLDPDPALPWSDVTAAALELRDLLSSLDLVSFLKTTGGKGLHLVSPIRPGLDWERVKSVAHAIAKRLADGAPQRYTIALAKNSRRRRIFIDYLRNSRGQTAVAPYSPRAREGAPVATPLAWAELEAGARPQSFTVATLPKRLARGFKDPWAKMAALRQPLTAALLRELGVS